MDSVHTGACQAKRFFKTDHYQHRWTECAEVNEPAKRAAKLREFVAGGTTEVGGELSGFTPESEGGWESPPNE